MSVWDTPRPSGADAFVSPTEHGVTWTPGTVPVVDPSSVIKGTAGGRGLLNAQGRGVYNGVPLGETRLDEEAELERVYRLQPSVLARLRGATRQALGR